MEIDRAKIPNHLQLAQQDSKCTFSLKGNPELTAIPLILDASQLAITMKIHYEAADLSLSATLFFFPISERASELLLLLGGLALV